MLGLAVCWSFKRHHEAAVARVRASYSVEPQFHELALSVHPGAGGGPARAVRGPRGAHATRSVLRALCTGHDGICLLHAEAICRKRFRTLRECVSRAPNMRLGRLWLAATYGQLGQLDNARAEAAEVLRIDPAYTIDGTARIMIPFKLPEDAKHFFDSLRKAGVP